MTPEQQKAIEVLEELRQARLSGINLGIFIDTKKSKELNIALSLAISALQNEERLVEALEYFMDGCGCDGIEKCRYCENAKSALAKKGGER
jgi:hypothetical protein